jgi:hypothetical protein
MPYFYNHMKSYALCTLYIGCTALHVLFKASGFFIFQTTFDMGKQLEDEIQYNFGYDNRKCDIHFF